MSSLCKPKTIIPATLLMLVGSMLMVIGPASPYFGHMGGDSLEERTFSVILSDAEPSYVLNLSRSLDRVGISNLITNETPVRISGVEQSHGQFLEISNLTRIGSDRLIVEGRSNFWALILSKQSGDVNLSFTVEYWRYIPPPDITAAMPVQLFIPGTALVFIAAFMLLRIERNCSKKDTQKKWEKHEGAFAIIVLVLLSAMLALPYIYGSTHALFVPTTQGTIDGYNHSFQLTDSSPTSTLDLTTYIPEDTEDYELSVRVDEFSDGPIRISTSTQSTTITDLANTSLLEQCRIIITAGIEDSPSLTLSRIDSDVSISILIQITTTFIAPLSDPTIPVILGWVAIIPAMLSLWRATWMTRRINRRQSTVQTQESSIDLV